MQISCNESAPWEAGGHRPQLPFPALFRREREPSAGPARPTTRGCFAGPSPYPSRIGSRPCLWGLNTSSESGGSIIRAWARKRDGGPWSGRRTRGTRKHPVGQYGRGLGGAFKSSENHDDPVGQSGWREGLGDAFNSESSPSESLREAAAGRAERAERAGGGRSAFPAAESIPTAESDRNNRIVG